LEEIRESGGEAEAKGQIRLDGSSAEVSYANFALVATAAEEIILSFGVRTGEDTTVRIKDKVILSPKNAKRLLAALSQSLRLYEEKFGTIDASFAAPKEKPAK
jgi:hypothetical protein